MRRPCRGIEDGSGCTWSCGCLRECVLTVRHLFAFTNKRPSVVTALLSVLVRIGARGTFCPSNLTPDARSPSPGAEISALRQVQGSKDTKDHAHSLGSRYTVRRTRQLYQRMAITRNLRLYICLRYTDTVRLFQNGFYASPLGEERMQSCSFEGHSLSGDTVR